MVGLQGTTNRQLSLTLDTGRIHLEQGCLVILMVSAHGVLWCRFGGCTPHECEHSCPKCGIETRFCDDLPRHRQAETRSLSWDLLDVRPWRGLSVSRTWRVSKSNAPLHSKEEPLQQLRHNQGGISTELHPYLTLELAGVGRREWGARFRTTGVGIVHTPLAASQSAGVANRRRSLPLPPKVNGWTIPIVHKLVFCSESL